MKKFFTVGVFDLIHFGHVMLFKRANEFGDELIVAVQDSAFIGMFKPDSKIVYSTDQRLLMVHSIRYVDRVITYTAIDQLIQDVEFDVFVKGPDQTHAGFDFAVQWCHKNNKVVIELPRTEGISSSMVRDLINDSL